MAVAGENEIDAVAFEERQEVLADLNQVALGVGVVAALGVGRVMPEGDDPLLRRGFEIAAEPVEHRGVRRAA